MGRTHCHDCAARRPGSKASKLAVNQKDVFDKLHRLMLGEEKGEAHKGKYAATAALPYPADEQHSVEAAAGRTHIKASPGRWAISSSTWALICVYF